MPSQAKAKKPVKKKQKRRADSDDDDDYEDEDYIDTRGAKKRGRPRKYEEESEIDSEDEEDSEESEDESEEDEVAQKRKKAQKAKSLKGLIAHKKAFEFKVTPATPEDKTVDVVIGNFENAYEGSCDSENASRSWLAPEPSPSQTEGTVSFKNLPMVIPAVSGTWKATNLVCQDVCGVCFWHTELVGPEADSLILLIREFTKLGMAVIENKEKKECADKGLRLLGRYGWDHYRKAPGIKTVVNDQVCSELFEGPHCFFVPKTVYKNDVIPQLSLRCELYEDDGEAKFAFRQPLYKVFDSGALGVFNTQEYMFAKVFLHAGDDGKWLGVRALIMLTDDAPETFAECTIEGLAVAEPQVVAEGDQGERAEPEQVDVVEGNVEGLNNEAAPSIVSTNNSVQQTNVANLEQEKIDQVLPNIAETEQPGQ